MIKTMPNWAELFGSLELCECEQCRSVLSPAAYFVDILHFLQNSTPNPDNKSPYQILVERRPDLPHIKLTCENTNTPIPYIDLVNEILEYYIAHKNALDSGAAYDTGDVTADELSANPQSIGTLAFELANKTTEFSAAYKALASASFPTTLPYHQPLHATRIYLHHLGTSRAELLKTFSPDSTALTDAVVAEQLDLSPLDWEILTWKTFKLKPKPSAMSASGLYGTTSVSWVTEVSEVPEFLRRTGIAYTDLVALLKTRSINPYYPIAKGDLDLLERIPFDLATLAKQRQTSPPFTSLSKPELDKLTQAHITEKEFIDWANRNYNMLGALLVLDSPDSTCNLEQTTLRQLDANSITDKDLWRINRFIRLYRKLNWTIEETDLAVRTFGGLVNIDGKMLRRIAIAKDLIAMLGVNSVDEVLSLLGDLDVGPANSVYARTFLSRAVLDIDSYFLPDSSGALPTIKVSGIGTEIASHTPALVQAFRVSESDLKLIYSDLTDSDPSLSGTAPLGLISLLSKMYRYTVLARSLLLSVPQFVDLRKMSSLDLNSPEGVHALVTKAQTIKNAGWTIDRLSFLFRHVTATGADASDDALDEFDLAMALRTALTAVAAENRPQADPDGEFARNRLELLYGKEIADQTVQLIRGTANYSTPLASAPGWKIAILDKRTSYDSKTKQLKVSGPLTDSDTATLQTAAGTDQVLKDAVNSLAKIPRDLLAETLAAFLPNTSEAITTLINQVTAPPGNPSEAISAKFQYLLEKLLPYCQQRLEQSIIQDTIANALQLDPGVTAALLDTCASVGGKSVIGDDYRGLEVGGLTGRYANSANSLTMLRTDPSIDFSWGALSPDPTKFAADNFTVVWQGWLIPNATEEFTFTLAADDSATLTIKDGDNVLCAYTVAATDNPMKPEPSVTLLAGRPYELNLKFTEKTGDASVKLEWRSKSTPRQVIPADRLVPFAPVDAVARATRFLKKIAQLIVHNELTADEIRLLAKLPETGDLFNVTKVPVSRTRIGENEDPKAAKTVDATAPALFTQWQNLSAYRTVRNALPGGARTLRVLLGDGKKQIPALPPDSVLVTSFSSGADPAALSALSTDISSLMSATLGVQPTGLLTIDLMERLLRCFNLARRLGASITTLTHWSDPYPSFDDLSGTPKKEGIAQGIKRATKAKYDDKTWLTVAKSLSDVLRESQRQALLDYVITQPGAPFQTPEQAFEYFLLDVEMSSCMATSRIKQAIGAVQLFVQRCLMNLETDVRPSQIDGSQWEWMSHYRVWEANRKIFLYPENWIVEGLRKDKTPEFRELESALLQREITNETVEKAFLGYLRKLHEIARLEICGIYNEDKDPITGEAINRLHVFGRTGPGSPHAYYYRRREPEGIWTPWESVQLDIQGIEDEPSGVQLIPIVWNRQLYLFWPVYAEKAEQPKIDEDNPIDKDNPTPPKKYLEIKLAWSVYGDGKWMPKRMLGSALALLTLFLDPRRLQFRPSINEDGTLRIRCIAGLPNFIETNKSNTSFSWRSGAFVLSNCQPRAEPAEPIDGILRFSTKEFPFAIPRGATASCSNFLWDFADEKELVLFTGPDADASTVDWTTYNDPASNTKVLGKTQSPLALSYSFQRKQFTAMDPFFLDDHRGCNFVETEDRVDLVFSQLSNPNQVIPGKFPVVINGNKIGLGKPFVPKDDLPMPDPGSTRSKRAMAPWSDAADKLGRFNFGGLMP